MERYYKALSIAATGVVGWISTRLGILAPLLLIFMVAMVIDYTSGMMAAAVESLEHPDDPEYGWSSKKGLLGILKKVSYMFIVAGCMIADYVIVMGIEVIGWESPVKGFFAVLVTCWLILNEILSVFENAKRMHGPVPDWAIRYVAVMKHGVDVRFNYQTDQEEEKK